MAEEWLDNLSRELHLKKNAVSAERQQLSDHDEFISSHGTRSWSQLSSYVRTACMHINKEHKLVEPLTHEGDQETFFVTSQGRRGKLTLQVNFHLPTKSVDWNISNHEKKHSGGEFLPTREGNQLVYQDKSGQTKSVQETAAFLVSGLYSAAL